MKIGTIVTVGFLDVEFVRMFDVLDKIADYLPRPIYVQAGPLRAHPFFKKCEMVSDFLSVVEMNGYFENADCIIGHCGVGSLVQANRYGKRPILFPRSSALYEHIDDHQSELASKVDKLGVAAIVWPNASIVECRDILLNALVKSEPPEIQFDTAVIGFLGDRLVAVSSVGGHRAELGKIANSLAKDVEVVTDEDCVEVQQGRVLRFPSCARKILFPVRVVQAIRFLWKRPGASIITTGAGVGAVFVFSAYLLRRESVAIESLTRILAPSKWFRFSSIFATKAIAYEWSDWAKNDSSVSMIRVRLVSREAH